ncbi:NADPH-dependent F420 reductase [Aquiflexum sp.]|uniref:NADPH-dependent F420 reductase n=1 Tax=Aquiflexum sp. TaxID=1872584 RepID=UPI0035931255
MEIGILGATKLTTTLGKKLHSAGSHVIYGVRENFEAKDIEWKILNRFPGHVFSFFESIKRADIILICCENEQLPEICQAFLDLDLKDKTIIDCTNGTFERNFSCNSVLIQKFLGNKNIYKAFNNLGLDYPNSDVLGLIKETYFCGEEGAEKQKVKKLIEKSGFKPIDAGSSQSAYLLEAFFHLGKEIAINKKEKTEYHFKLITV